MPLSAGLLAPRGNGPLLVRGLTRRVMRCTFRSEPLFSDRNFKISGITRDSLGNPLANCIVDLFYTADDTKAATVESDATGAFSFSVGPNLSCYIVAYKAGSPDVAGTTVNTLVAA